MHGMFIIIQRSVPYLMIMIKEFPCLSWWIGRRLPGIMVLASAGRAAFLKSSSISMSASHSILSPGTMFEGRRPSNHNNESIKDGHAKAQYPKMSQCHKRGKRMSRCKH